MVTSQMSDVLEVKNKTIVRVGSDVVNWTSKQCHVACFNSHLFFLLKIYYLVLMKSSPSFIFEKYFWKIHGYTEINSTLCENKEAESIELY